MSSDRDAPADDPRRSIRTALLYSTVGGVVLYLLTVLALCGPRLLIRRSDRAPSRRGIEVTLTIDHSQAIAIVGVLSGLVIALAVMARGVADSVRNATSAEVVSLAVARSHYLGLAAYSTAVVAVYVGVAGAARDAPRSWSIVTGPLLIAVFAICVIAADLIVAMKSNPVIATGMRAQRIKARRTERFVRLKNRLARTPWKSWLLRCHRPA